MKGIVVVSRRRQIEIGVSMIRLALTTERRPIEFHIEELLKIRSLKGQERNQKMLAYSSPVEKSVLDRAFVYFDLLVSLYLLYQVFTGFIQNPQALAWTVILIPITLFVADVIGQAFHKTLDTYADEENLLWGKAAQEFRKHHENPSNLNHVSYFNHLAAFGRLMLPFYLLALTLDWSHRPALGFNLVLLLFILLNATEIHKQAHLKNPSWIAKKLQTGGLLISYSDHFKHHNPPFNSHYSVVNGWSQRLFDKTSLWLKIDKGVWKLFRFMPRIWIQDPRSIPQDVMEELKFKPELIPKDLLLYAKVYPKRCDGNYLILQQLIKARREAN